MTLKPNSNQVVVKQTTVDKTKSGIIVTPNADVENRIGEVVAMADCFFHEGTPTSPTFEVGSSVVFRTYSAPVKLDGLDYEVFLLDNSEIKTTIIK